MPEQEWQLSTKIVKSIKNSKMKVILGQVFLVLTYSKTALT